ncbi:tRNA (adenosine(37)-N6)-threonylcarbamoyltransferase complex ATPase subunit type 1 TsaE [Celeribacter baekdonensis]|uniref:tRNA (adenosine(37)-N6)-threonylcarbamoyltransferase complex ATPase subunit type 1 TsaE n=1 Tax=Celeribacter baekdonensis TaxID=875171 RepID=UPI0030DBF302
MARTVTLIAKDEAATARVAAVLAPLLRPTDVILLDGSLAAGKTFFTRALVRALGSEEAVTSPTYTIANIYETPTATVLHVDAYRLTSAQEFYHLGLEDYFDTGIAVIEWGERIAESYGSALSIHIGFGEDDSARILSVSASAPRWATVLDAMEALA